MVQTITRRQTMPASGDSLDALRASFRRSMLAENKSPRTVQGYADAVRLLDAYLADQGMPRTLSAIHREHVEAFIGDLLGRSKPGVRAAAVGAGAASAGGGATTGAGASAGWIVSPLEVAGDQSPSRLSRAHASAALKLSS